MKCGSVEKRYRFEKDSRRILVDSNRTLPKLTKKLVTLGNIKKQYVSDRYKRFRGVFYLKGKRWWDNTMSSPEELLQQVRDGTLSAQEFTNQFFSLGADVATYGHLINEAYSIQEERLTNINIE